MAVKRGVKRKEHENLSDANIEKVKALLETEKPITKKEACEILNITYNTTRLSKIIEEYDSKIETERKLRAANRGKPASEYEISTIVEDYLGGDSLKDISEKLYRSTDFVKRIIDEVGVPQGAAGENYSNYGPLPDQCVAESFNVGEFVWSSKYGSIGEITRDLGPSTTSGLPVYEVYIHQRIDPDAMLIDGKRYSYQPEKGGGFYCAQVSYDLGSLTHLAKYGVDVKRAIK